MKDLSDIPAAMAEIGARARAAAAKLAFAAPEAKRRALEAAAEAVTGHAADIIAANAQDMAYGREKGLSPAMLDRLLLDEGRIDGIATSLRAVADQADPVGEVIAEWDMPSRPAYPAGAHAAGRDRRDLREPPQRDRRCRRAVPEGGQRGDPARRLGKLPFQPGDPRLPGRGPARGRTARGCDPAGADPRPRRRQRDADA